jgi:hypothetical protein
MCDVSEILTALVIMGIQHVLPSATSGIATFASLNALSMDRIRSVSRMSVGGQYAAVQQAPMFLCKLDRVRRTPQKYRRAETDPFVAR